MSVLKYHVYRLGLRRERLFKREALPTSVLEAEPRKLDIQRGETGILFWFTLQTSGYDVIIDFRFV